MDLGLNGKVAVVAASSKGLGRACALELATEGADVVICSRDAGRIEEAAQDIRRMTGAKVLPLSADLTKAEDAERLITTTEAELGPVDILVANSGPPAGGRFQDLSDEDWMLAFELVTLGLIRLVRLVLPQMVSRGWGRVISIQSTSVKQPIPHLILSNGVRPAAQGILKTLVQNVAQSGVTINTVLPGMFRTDRLLNDIRADAEAANVSLEQQLATVGKFNPTGRVGEPEELAALVAFLASERSSFLNGAAIQIDGGSVRSLA